MASTYGGLITSYGSEAQGQHQMYVLHFCSDPAGLPDISVDAGMEQQKKQQQKQLQ